MSALLSRQTGVAALLLATAAWVNIAVAQQPARQPAPGQFRQPASAPTQGHQTTDHVLEQWLITDNQGEIELAKFAHSKAHSEDVRLFATMMQQDHTDFVNTLQQFHQRHAAAATTTGNAGAAGQRGGFDVIGLKRELGQQCVASFKKEFGELEGKQFDVCYMGHQVAAHMKMLDTLKVFQRHASPELAQVIGLGIETTEDHLMHAKEIVKGFQGPTAETVRRPAETQRK